MKTCLFLIFIVLTTVLQLSCKKESSCENCNVNKPPISIAGPNQVITLPTDNVLLDGRSSSDPDGTISVWLWTKISGPASFSVMKPNDSMTIVNNLTAGAYQFELKVTDNDGLSSKDTVQVIVNNSSQPNRPPIANAGMDQTIILPVNSIILNGNGSMDPDYNIISYLWTKISGPSSFNIISDASVQTQVTVLVHGEYHFELKVTDAGGLFSKDTVVILVNYAVYVDCNGIVRPEVTAQLIPINTLSLTREGMAIAAAGNKILFAGGYTGNYSTGFQFHSRVDIFDVSTNSWTTAELSQPRMNIGVAVLNNRVYFAGGEYANAFSSRVDVYDVPTNSWTTAELSQARSLLAGAAAGNKVLFAGGYGVAANAPPVDILDVTTNTWTIDSLRNRPTQNMIGDAGIAATAIGNKIYFAGNASDWLGWDFGSITSTINIYDVTTGAWSTSDLSMTRGFMASIAVSGKNYWAGGVNNQSNNFTAVVEIRDANSGISSFECLSRPNAFFSAIQKNNKIVFFTLGPNMPVMWSASTWQNKFDIFDITSNTWSIGILPVTMASTSIISVNNTIYLAGGLVNGVVSNQVWKLEF